MVYIGPSDFLSVDQGTAYPSRQLTENIEAEEITLLEAPIETPRKIGAVSEYHDTLPGPYTKLGDVLERSTSDAECVKIATFAVNSAIGRALFDNAECGRREEEVDD